VSRLVTLPGRGTLLIATDFQGNLGDFERIAAIFEQERSVDPETFLVVTGDLVHGPELGPDEWPEHLGSYYFGQSVEVLERAQELQRRHPAHVTYLLGNHEHAHLGGPVVGKFFPDEAARLEDLLGPDRAAGMRRWMATWPLVVVAPAAGLCLLHAAPHAGIRGPEDIERLDLGSLRGVHPMDLPTRTILGSLLWARSTSLARARSFLKALGPTLTTAIHGHDVVREGFVVEEETHLCVSSSFGCHDGDKLYVRWPLSEPAASAADVARRGLRRLWPEATPVHLEASLFG
jgi:3',5'-cyclic AMP phosphodiesterase CpdA